MLRLLTACLILLCFTATAAAARPARNQNPSDSSSKEISKLKNKAMKAGIDSKVRVRLRSGERLKGRLIEVGDEALTLQYASDTKLESRQLDYAAIADIRRDEGMSTGAKVAIGAGVGAGVALTTLAILISALR